MCPLAGDATGCHRPGAVPGATHTAVVIFERVDDCVLLFICIVICIIVLIVCIGVIYCRLVVILLYMLNLIQIHGSSRSTSSKNSLYPAP